jgi:hypothetical protein
VGRSLGWNVKGTSILVPDFGDADTLVNAAKKRVMRAAPRCDPAMRRRFRSFVRVWIRKHLIPLSPDCDLSLENWLAGTTYPDWRKKQLRAAAKDYLDIEDFKNKSFIKREAYREPKHARWINSRTDAFKCLTGPVFKFIEGEVYKHPAFIKHIPVAERSAYIVDLLQRDGCQYIETDHTSFEAHFEPEVMKICEFQLYWYMIQNLPESSDLKRAIRKLADEQFCGNIYTAFKTWARMSGDMCTSLGNGFTNLMIMCFLAQENGWPDCVGVVEGDDGLFVASGVIPTEEQYEQLGFRIKLNVHSEVCDAGFCGIYHAPGINENLIDPAWALVRSGWSLSKWMHGGSNKLDALSRAKALSLLCEAPANPITASMSLWIERATRGVVNMPIGVDEDSWWIEQCLSSNLTQCIERAKLGPNLRQRHYVSEKWGVSVEDQLALERYFDGLNSICEIDHPVAYRIVCDAYPWCAYAHTNFTLFERCGERW